MINLKINGDSFKVNQTKQIIKDAFIELYKNNPIDKISIKEITTLKSLNRGTFYIHFKDIYDLLEQIENEFLSDVEEIASRMLLTDKSFEENFKNSNAGYLEVLKYVKQKEKNITVLFGTNQNSAFIRRFKNHIKKILHSNLKNFKLMNSEISEFSLEYISSANMGIIIYWVETGMKIPEEDLVQMMGNFLFKGPLSSVTNGF